MEAYSAFWPEAELFQAARTNKKIGKFQLAHGETIFLDEVGEMPLNM
ncbi:MAG: sigma 54-interacting transcriptional regulator [Bdellovibrionota bacterium]